MKRTLSWITFISVLIFYAACQKEPSPYLTVSIPQETLFIGHKGSGNKNQHGNIGLQENTWEAIVNAMNSIDGSEIDIQISLDSTLWIFHSPTIENCNKEELNFALLSDTDIKEINKCNYNQQLLQLSEFLLKAKKESWNDKLICLDLKALYNPETLPLLGGYNKRAMLIRDKLDKLLTENEIKTKIVFEVFNEAQYRIFDSVFKNQTYWVDPLVTASNIQKNNKENILLSLPLEELIDKVDPSFVQIQNLWTIETANDFYEGLKFTPDIMQSNNVPLMQFFKKLQNGDSTQCVYSKKELLKTINDEFINVMQLELPLEKNSLIHLDLLGKAFPDSTTLIIETLDSENNIVDWQETNLNERLHSYHFINPSFLTAKSGKVVNLYFWNKSKVDLNQKYILSQFVLL